MTALRLKAIFSVPYKPLRAEILFPLLTENEANRPNLEKVDKKGNVLRKLKKLVVRLLI
jgi:hypothetical protein